MIFVFGCSAWQEAGLRREMRESLQAGNRLFIHGDYDESLKTFQSVVAAAQDKPPADVAVYTSGVIYAHPNNPKRDLDKAMKAFSRVVSTYPASPLAEQSKSWVAVLKEAKDAKQKFEESRRAIERSQLELEKNRQAIENSRQEVERSRAELEKTKQEIEKAKQVIEKYKQVDIEIDQKRRDRGR